MDALPLWDDNGNGRITCAEPVRTALRRSDVATRLMSTCATRTGTAWCANSETRTVIRLPDSDKTFRYSWSVELYGPAWDRFESS